MDKFGHFFEFFAALNSAYIVSNHFLEALVSKINRHFTKLKDDLSIVENYQSNSTKKLQEKTEKQEHTAIAVIIDLGNKNENIKKNIDALNEKLTSLIKKNSVSEYFNYWCLFGCLYCLLILLLNGFEFDFSTSYMRESFLIFNIFSLGILFWLFSEKKSPKLSRFYPSYNKILIVFFASTLVFPIHFFCEKMWPIIDCSFDFKFVNIVISLIVPTSHFVYYFGKSSTTSRRIAAKLKNELDTIQARCDKFAEEMNTTFNVIEKLKVTTAIDGAESIGDTTVG